MSLRYQIVRTDCIQTQINLENKVCLYLELKSSFPISGCQTVKYIKLGTRDNARVNICKLFAPLKEKCTFHGLGQSGGFGAVATFTSHSVETMTASWGCCWI